MPPHLLILGGTTEARELAAALAAHSAVRVTTSLAGRVTRPAPLTGDTRTGGFGGPEGLSDWLRAHHVDALVDATHPFARQITTNALQAARQANIPALVLRRPAWHPTPDDNWHPVPSLTAAAATLPALGPRVLLTTGRLGLSAFAALEDLHFLVRSVEPPAPPLPPHTELLLTRGPFILPDELHLLRTHRIDVLVTKNSGGAATAPKLTAARQLDLPVVIVERPPLPEDAVTVPDVGGALDWLGALGISGFPGSAA
ncbi:cobalt-precorrin-6A reductase [Streptomyces sp. NPDC004549]|uniref:cobalt-precorrin-6A reductase n=1 Tax=Streptomyces sp. NPDC004549 TaxID=3154283 RepID=UPI0033A63B02